MALADTSYMRERDGTLYVRVTQVTAPPNSVLGVAFAAFMPQLILPWPYMRHQRGAFAQD